QYVPNQVVVLFARGQAPADLSADSEIARSVGGRIAHRFDFRSLGESSVVISVPSTQADAAVKTLQQLSGVEQAYRPTYRRLLSTTAVLTSDPYYKGFTGGNTPPLYEAPNVPGQWDMHVICAANAWAYSQANSTGRIFPGATGSASVKVAIVDTGAELTHPELSGGKIVYAETDLGVPVKNDATMHDNEGHGTDVAGIAAGNTNNAVGFASVGYNTPLMVFKVFPDPPAAGCPAGTTDPACQASETDEVSGINGAVAAGAKVINLSLGSTPNVGQSCAAAAPNEARAIAAAIAAGVVVVAASGNESLSRLDCPAGDPGVIAVGASTLDDSNPNAIGERVAGYSNYVAGSSTWGLVAPGGDPVNNDPDDLHWIENITSSTSSIKTCTPDFGNPTGPADCRLLIAGTSQSTPHVAGAAALLLAVNPGLTPAAVGQILCNTAVKYPDARSGCGRLNVYRAMASAVGDPSP
ncbi:MAG: S8 family serine peptidase, partial [Candidatus Eremiobacteraeota bacterium]|nr:S8 family serine peptidase [Candidatus Eremiobacteraeota bacterium]